MIVPNRHVADTASLADREVVDFIRLKDRLLSLVRRSLKPEGFNLGANLGRIAGAGIPGHLHYHLVPRWAGDTNFMPLLAHTKVISESLDSLYARLTHAKS
jgi:ATP adenylyltransferase